MTRYIYSLLFAIAIIGAATAFGQDSTGEESMDTAHIAWVNDFEDAQAKAIADNKLILLDFYSDT